MIRPICLILASGLFGLFASSASSAHDPNPFRGPTPDSLPGEPIPKTCEELANSSYTVNTPIKEVRELWTRCDKPEDSAEQAKPMPPEDESE